MVDPRPTGRLQRSILCALPGIVSQTQREVTCFLGDIYPQAGSSRTMHRPRTLESAGPRPGDPAAMLGLATVYLSSNCSAGAMEIAQAALLRSPNDPELNPDCSQRRWSASASMPSIEPYLNRSLSGKPQMIPRIHALMGKVYAETGRTQEGDQLNNSSSGAPK